MDRWVLTEASTFKCGNGFFARVKDHGIIDNELATTSAGNPLQIHVLWVDDDFEKASGRFVLCAH